MKKIITKSHLVSMTEILTKAKAGKYAVPAININNLEWTIATLKAAQAANSPIILATSEGAAKYMKGFKLVTAMVNNLIESMNITVPVALHLDHGSYEGAIAALKAGYSSVMFDGSHLSFEENIKKTKAVVWRAKLRGASVEAEVGAIGGEEDGISAEGELADVKECVSIVETGVNALACGIGNIHGIYPKNWKGLSMQRLSEINAATNQIPIVLHGGTGIPTDQIKKAIRLGVSKINVNTECQLAFASGLRTYIGSKKDLDMKAKGFDPRKILAGPSAEIEKSVSEKIKIFGSKNKA